MTQTNIKLYQEARKADREDYETPYESFATDFYQKLVTEKLRDKDMKVLDVGCFKGILVDKLRNYKSFGLDVTADGFFKPGKYIVGAAEHLPIKSDALDCVSITEVIEHIIEPQEVFQEIHRVLKPPGYLLITHPNKYNFLDEFIEHIKENNFVRRLLNRPLYTGVQHVQKFTYDNTIHLLKPIGFAIESCHALTFSFYRVFSIFIYGRFKFPPIFKFISKIIELEYFLIRKMGKAGLLLAGSCIMLFKISKTN